MGLAIPFEKYYGVWKRSHIQTPEAKASNTALGELAHYIIHHPTLSRLYDTNTFLEDIDNGLYFDSNIPQGYGLGSSGALVSAVYRQYRKTVPKNYVISEVKNELAELESHFHGKSSGLDAIVCFLNKAVLVTQGEVSEAYNLPAATQPQLKAFLINTHIARQTAPFVSTFLQRCNDVSFMKVVTQSLVPANNIAVQSFMRGKHASLVGSMKIISQLQLDILPDFIPSSFHNLWKESLRSNAFHLKLCGAGGGGFILGIAPVETDLSLILPGVETVVVLQF